MNCLRIRDEYVLFLDQPMTYEAYRRGEHVAAWTGKAQATAALLLTFHVSTRDDHRLVAGLVPSLDKGAHLSGL
jgi:hypothetical protein